MQNIKSKSMAILIAVLLTVSMSVSMTLIQSASAHSPSWDIPTYAYIAAAPNPIGVGQTMQIYMWLDEVYGAAGGSSDAQAGNASSASAALLSNAWRFQNYSLTVTPPNGTATTTTFSIISDSTSNQATAFTPSQVGTYTLTFNFPGQYYGAKDTAYPNGDGYQGSSLEGDYYEPANATTTLVVQSTPIPAATTSEPLPTAFWMRPIYGLNSNWYTLASNWLGSGSAGYSAQYPSLGGATPPVQVFHPDGVGSLTSHIMWTKPLQSGGVVGGTFGTDYFQTETLDPTSNGVGYFEGSAYEQRFGNPIIVDGFLYYNGVVGFTGPSSGPLYCVNLATGQVVWTLTNANETPVTTPGNIAQSAGPVISLAYVYNLWDPDEHGTFTPILFTSGFATAYDAYTGVELFNVTGVPSGTAAAGPDGEQLKYVMTNDGTTSSPAWYLSEWNSSRIWVYDISPFTGSGSTVPSVLNASLASPNNAYVDNNPLPSSAITSAIPQAVTSTNHIIVNANIPINATTLGQIPPYESDIASYDWNISILWHNAMTTTPTICAASYDDLMLLRNGSLPAGFAATDSGSSIAPYTYFAVDLNTSHTTFGQVLWTQTYNPPAGNLSMSAGPIDFNTGVFTLTSTELANWYGYSLTNGNLLYTTPSQAAFDYYGAPLYPVLVGICAYGNLYSSSFSGILYCYNDLTGALKWTYGNGPLGSTNSTNSGFNTSYGDYPTEIQAVASGTVYMVTCEHTITDPIYKGAMATAVNATNGAQIWTLSDYTGNFQTTSYALADGYNVWFNGYDDQIYTVGQGPSATTVTAPQSSTTAGSNVVIQGTVMDISPGTLQTEQTLDFPHGVPVAADSIMGSWMAYVYQQQAIPTNFKGVTVTLTAIDPNGNSVNIGTATTDSKGFYYYTWTPPSIPGSYLITASFGGTNSYYGSDAQTAMTVQNAASPTATPTATPTSVANAYFIPAIAGLFVLIIVVAIVLALLMLRKRP